MTFPRKVQGLRDAAQQGLSVPPTLFLSDQELRQKTHSDSLNRFLSENPHPRYIIRSCVSIEDDVAYSLAGHFHSSGSLAPPELNDQIWYCFRQNSALLQTIDPSGEVNLMVQPFLEAQWGGVAFLPWKYYTRHVLINSSPGGPQAAVEGRDQTASLLSLDPEIPDGITLPPGLDPFRNQLIATFKSLRHETGRSVDIEWILDPDGQVFVVQLRPVTREPLTLFSANEEQIQEQEQRLEGFWGTSGISESFGNLSPLSFSLFTQLFEDASAPLKRFGIQAGVSFLHRLPSGQILSNPKRARTYFRFRRWTGAFRFGLKEPYVRKQIHQQVSASETPEFSYTVLLNLFVNWQLATLYFVHRERGKTRESPLWAAREYELTCVEEAPSLATLKPNASWEQLRNAAKRAFLSELRKLKTHIFRKPEAAFLTWEEWASASEEEKTSLARRNMKVALSPEHFVSFPSTFGSGDANRKMQNCIAGQQEVQAECLTILDPAGFTGALPPGVIVVAPYFRNDWVPGLQKLAGVILEQGGQLSHSAIVAREHHIPYFIHVADACSRFTSGKPVRLIPRQQEIRR